MTAETPTCAACHSPLPPGAHFCNNCGRPTPTEPGVPERTMPTGAVEVHRVRQALSRSYRIEHVLGEGGMATVYLAEDLKHRRKVAVKVMRPELAETLGAERFLREVEIAAKLSHPHILPVYDSGASEGILYYVMPLVDGESLPVRLRREKQLPVGEALRLAREVAEALAYAHKQGIVHRDIKPANILLSDGHALVADFGIARAMASDGKALTQTGLAIGTPQYMAPEQASGESNIDGRADIYALGCVLYEMIAGEPPFTGPTAQAIITRSITEDARPLTRVRGAIPGAVDTAVQKALAKAPADRWESATAFATALEGAEHRSTLDHRPSTSRWKIAAAAIVVLTIGAGSMRIFGGGPAGGEAHRVAVLPFENHGADDEAYFADGIVEELRNRLARLDGFTVIASTSADLYRETTKSATEIARELRVTEVLTGRVRWASAADGTRQFQVTTELVNGESGEVTWRDTFTGTLSDPFAVQGQIATRVAGAMGAALSQTEAQDLAGRPTDNAEAYNLYLQAREIIDPQVNGVQSADARRAANLLERAVALDDRFAAAWVQLARSLIVGIAASVPDTVAANRGKEALDRAVALAPDSIETLMMAITYNRFINNTDEARRITTHALRLHPDHPRAVMASANIDLDDGNLESALAKLDKARELDPRSQRVLSRILSTNLSLGRYTEARAAAEEFLALEPTDLSVMQQIVRAFIAAGDSMGARRVTGDAMRWVPRTDLVAYFAGFNEMAWLLSDEDRQLLYRLTSAAFDNDRAWWAQALATAAWQQGDRERARAYADSGLAAAQAQIKANPDNPELRILNAVTLGMLGRRSEAMRETELALADTSNILVGDRPYVMTKYAVVQLLAGETERALDMLEEVLQSRAISVSPGMLRFDPTYRPLHGNPRFERLANRGIGAPVD